MQNLQTTEQCRQAFQQLTKEEKQLFPILYIQVRMRGFSPTASTGQAIDTIVELRDITVAAPVEKEWEH